MKPNTSASGFPAVTLENRYLVVELIPTLGGRLWQLTDKLRNKQWVWHRQDVGLAPHPVGTGYDDVWAGGWEELFPNDSACAFEGRQLPDHGEWWSSAWRVEGVRQGPSARLTMSATMRTVAARCTKYVELDQGSPRLTIGYRITSQEDRPFHFLFKPHFPISLGTDCRLRLPGGRARTVDQSFSTIVSTSEPFDWPNAKGPGGPVDMEVVQSRDSASREFLYVDQLKDNWCGVDDLSAGASLRLHADLRRLPYLWLFLSYGGWKNTYTAVLEPCTNVPKNLAEAVAQGTSSRLDAGSTFDTALTVVLGEVTNA